MRVESRSVGESLIWCADLQEELRELEFVNKVHYSPAMWPSVAERIAQGIAELRLLPAAAPAGANGR